VASEPPPAGDAHRRKDLQLIRRVQSVPIAVFDRALPGAGDGRSGLLFALELLYGVTDDREQGLRVGHLGLGDEGGARDDDGAHQDHNDRDHHEQLNERKPVPNPAIGNPALALGAR